MDLLILCFFFHGHVNVKRMLNQLDMEARKGCILSLLRTCFKSSVQNYYHDKIK